MLSKKEADLKAFYETFLVGSVKDKKSLKDEILYSLFKKPIKDKKANAPTIPPMPADIVNQIDILYLPNDDGFKYALVVVDVGNRMTDAEPVKHLDSKTILDAILKIYARKIIKRRIVHK